jgi:hypothetical protein
MAQSVLIVTIISFHKSLLINTLNGILGLYDNKDKQDKQNMSYWKEIILDIIYKDRSTLNTMKDAMSFPPIFLHSFKCHPNLLRGRLLR